MSEEEKETIEILKDYYQDFACEHKYPYLRESITTILELIEKQQKEIEELKKEKEHWKDETSDFINKCLEKDKEIEELKKPKYMMNFETGTITQIDNNFISKDKIREKIEKEKKYQETIKKLFQDSLNYHIQEYAIEVLEELLEEQI